MITILNRDLSKIFIEESYGLTHEAKAKGIYEIGEGILGAVVKTGCAILIRDISTDKRFFNKTGFDILNNEGAPFICVPIKSDTGVLGTLRNKILEDVEKQMIIDTLVTTKGNLVQAAEIMGVTERILGLRTRKYMVDPKRYKVSKHNMAEVNAD